MGCGAPAMEAKTVVPKPVQKTMFIGLPNERKAPLAKSPRAEARSEPALGSRPAWASLIASHASLIMSVMPTRLRIIFAILF